MNKTAFLSALEKELRALPPEERSDAMQYYREYFEEVGPDREEEAAAALGSPKEIAAELLAAAPSGPIEPKAVPSGVRAGSVVGACLLIFLTFVLGVASAGLLLSGICVIAVSISTMTFSAGFGAAILGAGLIVLGLGGLSAGGAIKSGGQCRKILKNSSYKGEAK